MNSIRSEPEFSVIPFPALDLSHKPMNLIHVKPLDRGQVPAEAFAPDFRYTHPVPGDGSLCRLAEVAVLEISSPFGDGPGFPILW